MQYRQEANMSTCLYRRTSSPFARKKNSPVVPAGVIFRKCLTKSSLFSDFALKARPRIILFVSGSGLVKDAGSNCRVSWNWITISLTSLVERNEMDWMELLTFSGSASSFRVVPWKWYRNHWKNIELHWVVKLIFFFFFFKYNLNFFFLGRHFHYAMMTWKHGKGPLTFQGKHTLFIERTFRTRCIKSLRLLNKRSKLNQL